MTDFPNNFDYVIYGTGVSESIISAALSTTGHSVLHIDKNSYYGGFGGCLRIGELLQILDEWKQTVDVDTDQTFIKAEQNIKYVNYKWFVRSGQINGETDATVDTSTMWSQESLKQRLRVLDIELLPRIILCESETVEGLIQSDVKRYLEFQFVNKFATFSDSKLSLIPISRSDIFKTKLLTLRQKRQLTSFLEWCFSVSLMDDELILKYAGQPLRELMKNEKFIDEFIENIIIECLVLSSQNVETKEGILRLKRLLNSFNKVGPYPILWPNYGAGEIPQAFCRMSAVFGGVYSLATCINQCVMQDNENGYNTEAANDHISNDGNDIVRSIEERKLKLSLSNDTSIYTDKLIMHKSYLNSDIFKSINDNLSWVSRAILITNKSLIDSANREHHDILLLPLHFHEDQKPVMLLELPAERRLNERELYIVHLTLASNVANDSEQLFDNYIRQLFDYYNPDTVENTDTLIERPQILFQCFFTLPEYSQVEVDPNNNSISDIIKHMDFVSSCVNDFEFDCCFKEAKETFYRICHGTVFLPPPPDPENIIQVGNEAVTIGGDNEQVNEIPADGNGIPLDGPGDISELTNFNQIDIANPTEAINDFFEELVERNEPENDEN